MRISVIGTGYLGATHAACLAELGFDVLGVDSDATKVARLSSGRAPFSEPGLDEMLDRHVRLGRLRFTTSVAEAAAFADLHFLCVGTPQRADGGAADLSSLVRVTAELAEHLRRDSVVVGKSTVPVGTAELLGEVIDEKVPPGVRVSLAWNPEFLREGRAVRDSLCPDRLVLGVSEATAEQALRAVYAAPIAAGCPVHVTDLATAELAKTAANCFLATKISFINAMAEVCDASGADVSRLADILGDDARIGRSFLDAGIGFGGGCLPKDVRAFATRADELDAASAARLMEHVDDVNLRARQRTVELAVRLCGPRRGQRIAVLGAAFKPLSDDVRDSPALAVADELRLHGADVRVYDPVATANAQVTHPQLAYAESLTGVLTGADLVLHLTEWPEFRQLDPAEAGRLVRHRVLVDGRNALDHDRWRAAGWQVASPGRPAASTGPRRLVELAG